MIRGPAGRADGTRGCRRRIARLPSRPVRHGWWIAALLVASAAPPAAAADPREEDVRRAVESVLGDGSYQRDLPGREPPAESTSRAGAGSSDRPRRRPRPPGDPVALRDAIRHLLENRALAAWMGAQGRHQAEAYRASDVIPRLEQIYRRLIGAGDPEQQRTDPLSPAPATVSEERVGAR